MNLIVRSAMLGLTLMLLASPAPAQIYKWVDEKGVTHYSEKPPASKGQPMTLRDPTGGPSNAAQSPEQVERKLQEQERDFQQRQAARNKEEEAERKAQAKRNTPATERARQVECQRANRDLSIIRGNPTSHTFAEESRVRDSIARNCP